MHPFDDNYLSKMSPGFEKKPTPETIVLPQQALTIQAGGPVERALAPKHPAPELFDAIAALIKQHLSCDQHQLTVLTLWIAHTWVFPVLRTATYINIRSPQPQSGKSVCLTLLRQLSRNPMFVTGASAHSIMKHLLTPANRVDSNKFNATIFLDDCHRTFGASERQPLLGLLNSGLNRDLCYFAAPHEYSFFGPKAFAGNDPLPPSLAARCIPITLRRRKRSDALRRLYPDSDRQDTLKLVEQLGLWASRNSSALVRLAQQSPPGHPDGLAPHEQDAAEPLIHIADLIGGSWPKQARLALDTIFRLAEGPDGIELLCDIRSLFYFSKDPEYLSTKDLLSSLGELEHRPWSGWGSNSGKKLGRLLRPFGIHGRNLHRGSEKTFRGYLFEHFKDAWERYVPPLNVDSATKNRSATDSAT